MPHVGTIIHDFFFSVYELSGFINNLLLDLKSREYYELCMISYKLELGLQGESVDGQEAIEGSSIDQLYDEIWEVHREYTQ